MPKLSWLLVSRNGFWSNEQVLAALVRSQYMRRAGAPRVGKIRMRENVRGWLDGYPVAAQGRCGSLCWKNAVLEECRVCVCGQTGVIGVVCVFCAPVRRGAKLGTCVG